MDINISNYWEDEESLSIAALTEMLRHELPENSRIKITNIETGHILTNPEPPSVAIKGQIIPHLFSKDVCDAVQYSLDTSPITNIQEIILGNLSELDRSSSKYLVASQKLNTKKMEGESREFSTLADVERKKI